MPILITLGDPAGIGAEVILKALASPELQHRTEVDWRIVGSGEVLQQTYDRLRALVDPPPLANPANLAILDIPLDAPIQPGHPSAHSGDLSFQYLDRAVDEVLAGQGSAIVTAPIAKSAWMDAGHFYPGQTEFLAEKAQRDRFGMLFVAQSPHTGWMLRTLLATTHIPLCEVPQTLTPDLLTQKLDLLIETLMQSFGITSPHIAIAGLNPHSGEAGKLGREEEEWIRDWLHQAQAQYPQVTLEGLVPPDTLWVKPGQAWWHSPAQGHDAYLALYHDQGLIPVKLLAFDRAVNTTIGLPFLRTSPDHGTAFNIAGQGIAQPQSMIAALDLAVTLTA
ncbi:MAG: 4-hydroxythreonine-4-phosphate dehydrogenase PdxA [Prochlorotrichaceae cyanobacterium]